MLSSTYEAAPRIRSLPMTSSQPPGSASGSVLAPGLSPAPMSAPMPTGSVVVGSQVTVPSSASAPGSTLIKNGAGSLGIEEEVRTLFVSGLPMDVRLRELYLLFRCYEGYEGSFLKLISSKPGKHPQPIAFVSFKIRKQAEKALNELQGVRFDPASSQTLRLEFARTNSRVSPRQQQQQQQQQHQQHQQQQLQSHLQQQPPPPQQLGHPSLPHSSPQQQFSPHSGLHSHSPLQQQQQQVQQQQQQQQQQMAAMALGQAAQGYYSTFPPNKNNCYYFMPNIATLQAQQNAAAAVAAASAQGMYGMADNWSHLHLPIGYSSLSHVSTPSPTLSPAPSTPHLSVLNILSDTDSSAAPSPTPDHLNVHSISAASHPVLIPPSTTSSALPVMVPRPLSSVLVVRNLEPHFSEEDVAAIFENCRGLDNSKVVPKGGQTVAMLYFQDSECAREALERYQGYVPPSSKTRTGLHLEHAQSMDGNIEGNSGVVANPTPSNSSPKGDSAKDIPIPPNEDAPASISLAPGSVGDPASITIPAQVSIPVQYQNGGMGALNLSQQMADLDLNVQNPSPPQSVSSSAAVGMPPRQGGLTEFSQQNRSQGFGGLQNYTGTPIMYSENYPQGALYMGSSSPMMASWQYNPSHPNQGNK